MAQICERCGKPILRGVLRWGNIKVCATCRVDLEREQRNTVGRSSIPAQVLTPEVQGVTPPSTSVATTAFVEEAQNSTCSNCGAIIGRLEKSYQHGFETVCQKCKDRLIESSRCANKDASVGVSCPQCGSENTARCLMIYSTGTSIGTSGGSAFVSGVGGADGAALGATVSRHKQQTLLAGQCAPPRKPIPWGTWAAFILLLIVTGIAILVTGTWLLVVLHPSQEAFPEPFAFLSIIFCLGAIGSFWLFLYANRVHKRNITRWQNAHAQWERSWICLRCGSRYVR